MGAPRSEPTSKACTGCQGLDDVLGGGLPRRRVYLLQGDPGVGKTTLALQFLLDGARNGERGLYVSLAESVDELRASAASHGWSLDAIDVVELGIADADEAVDEQYTLLHPAEVELTEVTDRVIAEVDRIQPDRVVIDSLSEFRLLAQSPLRYRRQILALKQRLTAQGRSSTVLLLDDRTDAIDSQLKSIAHGVMTLERSAPPFGVARRRVIVDKLRGVKYREGYHDVILDTGGIQVFPRLIAAEHLREPVRASISSAVPTLDALLGGGLDCGTSVVIIGPAGSGKSSITSQFVAAACVRGEKAAMFTFDENLTTLMTRSENLGLPFPTYVAAGTLRVAQVDPAELSPGEFVHRVRRVVEEDGVRIVVIDSLNGYLNAMPGEGFLLNQLHELLTFLSQRGVVTFLVASQAGLLGPAMTSPIDVSYLADTVILLRYFEAKGRMRKAISVVKKRTGDHEDTIRELALDRSGVRIGAPLEGFHGVLTGVPQYLGFDSGVLGATGAREA